MAPVESPDGGVLTDGYGRKEYVLKELNAAPAVTDVKTATGMVDANGREHIVLVDQAGIFQSPFLDVVRVYGADRTGGVSAQTEIQTAIDDAHDAGGGIVFIPYGTYKMTGTLTHRGGVRVMGVSARGSILSWATDLGAGTFAVTKDGSGIQGDAGSFADLRLRGPGGPVVLGVQTCNMDGIFPDQNVSMERVTVSNFRANLWLGQDHNDFKHCQFASGYYNVLFPSARESKGNHTFYDCELQGAAWACVAVEGRNNIDFSIFQGGQVGAAPYGFFKFDGPLGASTDAFLSSTLLIDLAFESIGNAAFWDESTGAGSGSESMTGVRIENPGFVHDLGWKIAGRSKDYWLKLRTVDDTRIIQGTQGFGRFSAPDIGIFKIEAGSLEIIQSLVYPKMFSPDTIYGSTMTNGSLRSQVYKAVGAISAGDLVEHHNSNSNVVRRYSNTVNFEYAGVALTTAADGEAVLIAQEGNVQVQMDTNVNPGWAVKPNTTGSTTPHHGIAAPNMGFATADTATLAPVVAVCLSNGGPGLVSCRLMRMHDRNYVKPGATPALPAAAAAYRGQMVRIEGGVGVADLLYICEKNAANAYVWRAI